MAHSAAEPTGQERRGSAAGAGSEDRGARATRAASLRAAPQGNAHRASRGLHPVSLPRPHLRRDPPPSPRRAGHDLVPAQLSALLRAARPGRGHRFLEVGVGSGYGTSLAREVVGPAGLVVAIDIDATTLGFARENLERAGYTDVVLIHGDGGLGYPEHAPYDRICVTAACPDVPPPLIEQLALRGRLIVPVMEGTRQRLTLLEKTVDGVRRKSLADVLYVSLQGRV